MNSTLIIFEFADEIDAFLAQRSINELKNNYVLAILPEAQVALKKIGISFYNTYSFFGKKEHESALLKCDDIYKFCEPMLKIEDDLGITQGYKMSILTYIRVFVNYLLWLIEIINNACYQWHIERIIVTYRHNTQINDPLLGKNEGYLSELVERIASKHGITIEYLQSNNHNNMSYVNGINSKLIEIWKYFIHKITIILAILKAKNKDIILATNISYNLDRVIKSFQETFIKTHIIYIGGAKAAASKRIHAFGPNISFTVLPTLLSKRKCSDFLKMLNDIVFKLELSAKKSNIFEYKSINFSELVFNKLKTNIIPAISNIFCQSLYLDKLLKKLKPKLIISQMGRYITYNLGELASLNNIPSILITHGSHVPPKNEYEMIEWKEHGLGLMNSHYRYVAVQSPWAKAYLEKVPTKAEQIITGPLLFAKCTQDNNKKKMLKKKLVPGYEDKIILVHADTPRQRMAMRFFVYQTVDEYIYTLNSLIQAVEQINKYHLIIRFRPLHYLSQEYVKPLLKDSDCYSIHSTGKIDDYLSIADMLISYSSTTIEEALQNRVPVLQYDTQGKYCHIKGQTLSPFLNPVVDSCYYVGSENDLIWSLKWLAVNHFAKHIPESVWERHIFKESEKIVLTHYFKKFFSYCC